MLILESITLPPSLHWLDRDDWQPVAQSVRKTLDGTLAVFHAPRPSGRPITLASTEDQGWITRATLDALQALAAIPGAVQTLTIGAQAFQVVWRHHDAPAIAATPILARLAAGDGDWYRVTLKFTAL